MTSSSRTLAHETGTLLGSDTQMSLGGMQVWPVDQVLLLSAA